MEQNWLLNLNQVNINDLSLVGGKALNLAQLARNELTVPQSLIASAAMFEAQIQHYAFGPIWAGSPDVAVTEGALQFLADFIKSTPLAPKIEVALQHHLKEMFPPEVQSFAVRSSAIDEDQHNYSFAGCYLTELGVPRDMLSVSLTRCWASALTGKAIQYRIENGMSLQAIKIAVLIQPMLKPTSAGVAFTLNPVSGARNEFVVEASTGLGESVAGGRVTPCQYQLARQAPKYPLIKKTLSQNNRAGKEPLSQAQLSQLAQTLDRVEALMGFPQDVEWAIQDERLYLLQTRPITSVANGNQRGAINLDGIFNAEWTRANHPDTLPDIPSPLFVSLMERTENRGINFFNKMGLDITGLGPYIKIIYGRPYLNLSIIKRILTQLGFSPLPMLAMAGYLKADTQENPFHLDTPTVWKTRKIYYNLILTALKAGQTTANYEHSAANIINNLQNPATSVSETLSQFKLRERVYGDLIDVGLILVSAITGLSALIAQLIGPLSDSPARIFQTLGTLGKDPNVIQHNLILGELSKTARQDPKVKTYLLENGPDFKNYQSALAETPFLIKFSAYLNEYGYRATYEADMSWPRFAEEPQKLLQTIQQYLELEDIGSSAPTSAPLGQQSIANILGQLTSQSGGLNRWLPWRKMLALPLMYLLKRAFNLRNRLFNAQAKAMAAIREWDLGLANQWVKQGFLDRPEDYFWLNMEEVEYALVTEENANVYLNPAIVARKKAYQLYAQSSVPFVIKDSEIPNLALQQDETEDILASTLMGLPVSPGQIQGVIEFLENVKNMKQVSKNNILVVPSTDPAYLPYFPLASGLIVSVGGMLSHGSIIAREYGLPAVSNIVDAHKFLRSGDRVLIDGSTGVVQILEKSA